MNPTLNYLGTGVLVLTPLPWVVQDARRFSNNVVVELRYTEEDFEEVQAAREAAAYPLTDAKLKKLAAKYPPPAAWWDGEEDLL